MYFYLGGCIFDEYQRFINYFLYLSHRFLNNLFTFADETDYQNQKGVKR
jgi:hypothetical protein